MLTGYALIAIPILLYATLFFGAMIYAAYISLWRWGLRGARNSSGSATTRASSRDPIFWKAVTNTLYYVAVWVPLTMALGLFLAIIVNQKLRGQTFFRAAFYFPRSPARRRSRWSGSSSSSRTGCSTASAGRSA